MFDLDAALAAWRRSMENRRAFLADDLDELEQHVRDQVAARVAAGLPEADAFAEAMHEMGSHPLAEAEYRKVYWGKVRRRTLLWQDLRSRSAMLAGYLTLALRAARRRKGFTLINVAGLAVGLAACLLIVLYVAHAWRYDRFHAHADRLYRVVAEHHGEDAVTHRAATPPALAPALQVHVPEVEHAVRFASFGRPLIAFEDRQFFDSNGYLVDSTVFHVFSFSLVEGDPATALAAPFTIVLTQSLSKKLFGEEAPLGQIVTMDHAHRYTVTGIMADLPPHAHLEISFLASYATFQHIEPHALRADNWNWQQFYTYVLLRQDYDPRRLEARLAAFAEEHIAPHTRPSGFFLQPRLQAVTDIHLHSAHLQRDVARVGSLTAVRAFSWAALVILLVACFNFVNLTTARALERGREVGLRKVAGAYRSQLVVQFLCESVAYIVVSLVAALVLVAVLLPAFSTFTGLPLRPDTLPAAWLAAGLVGLCLVVGIVAGGYPAFLLSSFQPAAVLKGRVGFRDAGSLSLRRVLVVCQFTLSIALALGTVFVFEQLAYLQERDLGFEEEQVVVVPVRGREVRSTLPALREELDRHPGVVAASASWGVPGGLVASDWVTPVGRDQPFLTRLLLIDHAFVKTFGMQVIAGRDLSEAHASDAEAAFLVNESAARALGWQPEEALGRTMRWQAWGGGVREGPVVGVVRDFHVQSLHQAVEPVVLTVHPPAFGNLSVRIRPGNVTATLQELESTWQARYPGWPFEYSFLDDQFAAMYASERMLGQLFTLASGLAVVIACLGLFGLAAFAAGRRRREIGIRRVLGASTAGLVVLFSKEFLQLVALAFLVATPIAYVALDRWLSGFAYRIGLSWSVFAAVGAGAVGVALLTVGYQAVRAATADPAKTLRAE